MLGGERQCTGRRGLVSGVPLLDISGDSGQFCLRRVVVAVPFISITEQNADVYRQLLDQSGEPPVVLEHHSGVDLDDRASGDGAARSWRRLASENWDAPFVVTTTVQLFQSLFDHRPAAMRKLHRLARSVIVLDEVQALPDRLLLPILSALRALAGCCNRSARMAEGRVVIFDPVDGGHPADSSYKAALHATGSYFGPGLADPDALDALAEYYTERYIRQNLEASGPGARIQRLRAQLDFPEVARAFQMIEEHTVPVAVQYGGEESAAEVGDLAGRLRGLDQLEAGQARLLLRRLQPYLATLPKTLVRKAVTAGYAEPVIGDLLQWHGPYHPQRGIDPAELADLGSREVSAL
jgi:hypothetical protein